MVLHFRASLNVRPACLPGKGGVPLNNLRLRPQRPAYGTDPPTLADERREADHGELALPVIGTAHTSGEDVYRR
jgi:hypothetical protein